MDDVTWLEIIVRLIIMLIFAFGVISFAWPIYRGATYAPTHSKIIEKMMELARIKPGEKTLDLGSGDGRIVIAMAKLGAQAYGFEKNPILVILSKWKIHQAGLKGKAFIRWKNFWKTDFSSFDCVTLFGIFYIMKDLEKKFQKELRPGARVVCNYYPFPDWQAEKKLDNIYLYIK